MEPIHNTVDFFNGSYSQAFSAANNAAANNAAADVQPNIDAVWDGLLNGVTGIPGQSQLQESLLLMPPAATLEGLGIHAPAVQEPIVAGGGLPQYPFSALANTSAAPQVMQCQNSETRRARNVCDVCSRDFTRPSSLQTHMRSHTGEKPYPCNYPGCFKRFSVLSNQRRHSKIHMNPALPRGPHSQYMVIDVITGRILGYRRYSDPFN
ncbi:hypothetical protein IWW35_005491 [Coemansia sp. RSA 1878]|nr:hypothetical protein IWW35_005491 [Coemansia sp. RSA 1878]